jgi:four helix bundle protein
MTQTGAQPAKKIDDYRGLIVWQKAMRLVVESYELAKKLPRSEIYGLTSQIQRAAVSIPANIAEGHGRKHTGDYIHHLSMANGSLKELETHFFICQELGFLTELQIEPLLERSNEIGRMLTSLIHQLRLRQG